MSTEICIDGDCVAYTNGHVYTVNKTHPWAEGFIVTPDGRFAAVGSTAEILAKARQGSMAVYDLQGQFIMPGIHDAHVHTIISGSGLTNWVQTGLDVNKENIAHRVHQSACACAYSHAYEDWLVGGAGFGFVDYDRSYLDEHYPETPVLLYGGGCHSWYANTAALRRAGYDVDNELDVPHGEIVRRPDGSLTGELRDHAGCRMISAVPRPPIAHIKQVIKRAIVEMHRAGVTSCQDASATKLLLTALDELEKDGDLKMQFATHILYKNEWLTGEVMSPPDKLILDAEKYSTRHVQTGFVKFMMDGACVPDLMSHSQVDSHDKPDMSKILLPNLNELIDRFDAKGMTCKIHCMGYGGSNLALDVLEELRRKRPNGPRHEIAHCTQILNKDFPRFRKLNVTAEMSPAGSFDKRSQDEYFDMFRFDFPRMVEEENHITIGSDWAHGAPLPLLPHVGKIAQTIGAEKTLEIITLAGVTAVGRGTEAGSIEVGKIASFISVDRDLTEGDFANAKVLKTWFEGELVYDASSDSISWSNSPALDLVVAL
ncbi:amidohydrolase family-domain-containing protein [Aspergillus bertholletiae]|uniref:Amidohydrolase family-domain-containing protein n=1 Tax=Aspergillus bertholletiae TaxID=1226010 RepID=A0A5N7AQ72_9EURO|nr:amidohydrolase family-domain-containing protein [Aspergillus bertholletiae]